MESLVAVTDEPVGEICPAGGKRVAHGIDLDGDGELDEEEVDGTNYVCNGMDGLQSLVVVTDEEPGDNCLPPRQGSYKMVQQIMISHYATRGR